MWNMCSTTLSGGGGRTGGERNIPELQKEMRLRSWVSKLGLDVNKVEEAHIAPLPVLVRFYLLELKVRNKTLYSEL
jgi:hypothetical protein